MKKKRNEGVPYWDVCRRKILLTMKLISIFMLFAFLQVSAETYSQNVKISLDMKEVSMLDVIKEIRSQTGFRFFFNHNELKNVNNITVNVRNAEIDQVLKDVLNKENFNFQIERGVIVITSQKNGQSSTVAPDINKITGIVVDKSGAVLPGVAVVIKGTTIGVATDADGKFSINVPNPDNTILMFSFIGMKSTELKLNKNQTDYRVTMDDSETTLDDVVVTGFFSKNKNSFTGSVKSLTVEDIKAVSNTNLISAISMLTPGLKIVENNQAGSNPNQLPEIVLRGTSSLSQASEENPNQPIIILDGVEITLRDLYDIDINEIERVDVLKDASATSLYGEKAANGVIVIERKKILNDKLRLSYNLDGSVDFPDLTTYDYLNAEDKLNFELLAKLYNFDLKDDFEDYNRKKLLVSQGMNTNWMSKPLRTGFSIGNSIGVSGKGNNMTYRVNANIRNVKGVMKDDYRNTYGLSLFLSYRIDNKLVVSLQTNYSSIKSQNSPYGTFSSYVNLNPYDSPYNEYGNLNKILSWEITNPLYEAECGNYYKTNSNSFTNNLNIRWDVIKGLYLTANGAITTSNENIENFTSPASVTYNGVEDLAKKGSLIETYRKGFDYSGNFVANYNQNLGDNNLLSIHIGGDIYKSDLKSQGFSANGFYKPNLHSTQYAAAYPENGKPSGSEDISTRIGAFANVNFIAQNKYFVDGAIRRSGSSKFGANNRFAPFWSVGAGWNIHNENFMPQDLFSTLRLRYSYGITGNISFSPYQAITTYIYNKDNFYLHGMGAIPKQMGNKNLTWQATRMHNIGLNADFFKNRFNLSFDYYIKTTDDLLIDQTIPPSVGESSVKNNLGKIRNQGYEFDLSAILLQTNDWRFSLKVNGAHNNNKILAISNGLNAANDKANQDASVSPKLLYKEGQSTTAIYAVKSAGINPANGKEVFIKRNGEYTETYNTDDKIVVGDLNPKLEGAIFPALYYKNWSLNISMTYKFGGQVYNTTRAANVENVNPKYNVDQRAYDERWKQVNDLYPYLDISSTASRSDVHSSRFVEDENTLEIKRIEVAYEFNSDIINKIGFKRLRLGIGMNDAVRFSSVKYERGTSYPFSRGLSFTISPTF